MCENLPAKTDQKLALGGWHSANAMTLLLLHKNNFSLHHSESSFCFNVHFYFIWQGIEQLKREQAQWERKSKWLSLKAVFGHPFSITWFSPFHSPVYGKQEYYMYNV